MGGRLGATLATGAAITLGIGGGAPAQSPPPAPVAPPPHLQPPVPLPGPTLGPSVALGVPWCGRLAGGVALSQAGLHFFTWDLAVDSEPNPVWRRYGTGRLVSLVRRVVAAHRRGYPGAGRVGIADLSLPRGGPFGPLYGGLGHLSHQNGRDVDILYPRRDRLEAPPQSRFQVDRMAAQDLIDRFVAAGAQYVFVGGGLGLRGPPGVVSAIPNHLDHMHVRIPADRPTRAPARCPWRPE
jgi:Penicillin-insensitive murein endopeptidase